MGRKKVKEEDKRINKSVAFTPSIFKRLEEAKGLMSRSLFVNIALDEKMKRDKKTGAV